MKYRAYLDIETTGLGKHDCDLAVIGVRLEKGRKIQRARRMGYRY